MNFLCLLDLIIQYHELNVSQVDEVLGEPSPLDFMRYVSKNRPFIAKKAARNWIACKKWNAEYLLKAMEGQIVNVAISEG